MSLTAQSDALAVGDSCRHIDVDLALPSHASASAALLARLLGHAPIAVADIADHRPDHLAEGCAGERL
jgi:hypothetical protein